MNKKFQFILILAGNIIVLFLISYYVIVPLKQDVSFDKDYKRLIGDVYLNPDLVDENADMKIDKQKFLDNLNYLLPPKVIFERFGSGYHEFRFELGITKDGKLGSIQIKKETDSPVPSTIGDFLGSHKFIQALSEIKYKPALLDGKKVGSMMVLTLIIAFDQSGNVIYPWYMRTYSSTGKIMFFDKSKSYKESEIITQAEVMPEMVGGIEELSKKIVYPAIAKKAGIEGRVIIAAVVDEKGEIIGAQLIRGLGAGLDEAAIEAIRQMKFRPGKINGKPVKVKVVFPIIFKLG